MTQNQPPGWDDWNTSEFRPVPPPPPPAQPPTSGQFPAQAQPGPHPHAEQQQYGYGYGPPPQKQGMSTGAVVALVLGGVLLIGLLIGGAFLLAPRLSGGTAAPATSTVSETVTAAPSQDTGVAPTWTRPTAPDRGTPPPEARECVDTGSGTYGAAAAGSDVTSCEFARVVWIEYTNTGSDGGSASITAFSPVTGQTYSLNCSGGTVVTCRGGNNAVVHIY